MAIELQIFGGILQNCSTDQEIITIPADVKMVSKHAFDSCPDVHVINLYPQYVAKELTDRLYRVFRKVLNGWDSELYTPCFPIYNIPAEISVDAIGAVMHKISNKYIEKKFKFITLNAEEISHMNNAQSNGNSAFPYNKLPFLDDDASQDGFGILFINGVTRDNYRSLGHNFDYNLIKYYTFIGNPISNHWLTVIGTSTSLEPSDVYNAFSKSCCWMKNPSEYLNYMNALGLVVE